MEEGNYATVQKYTSETNLEKPQLREYVLWHISKLCVTIYLLIYLFIYLFIYTFNKTSWLINNYTIYV